MNEQEYSESDSEVDDIQSDKKALPWISTAVDLVDKRTSLSDEGAKDYSDWKFPSSNVANQTKAFLEANALTCESLDLANKLKITSHNKSAPKSRLELENNTESFPKNAPQLEERTEINILLLGESGVGKSTFINSFANYMKHENFEAVQKNSLSVLIPARFNIFDKEFKKHLIEIGANDKNDDKNEYLADGAAATQDVKTYVFDIILENKSYLIRLIDTPGIGDPRGIDQDNKNCDYVLNYLGNLEKIHAICLLLKPTNTRLDVFLNYCVTQILSRLEKSATENMAFLFTNTRGQNYTPGDTYTSLELLVKKIKDTNNVSLPLSHKNVFCFDNEAFRFLASIKEGVEFREGVLEANIESWKYSYKEVYRLLSYIVTLNPHDPKKTVSINHARKLVLQLSQPLAEIVQLIGDNIYELDQHTHQLLMENQTLEELKQKLHMPVIDIRVKELSQPVTVCTAPQCSTIYKVAEKNKFHYKQRCHNPCYLNNVPAEIVGDPNLLQCWAMNKSTQQCHQCGCRFNTHMHIYYETDTFENKIVDQNVLKNINSKEDATKEKERMINNILNRKEELEKEHAYIIKCSAAFAHFLQQNAITPINDSLKEYIKYLISREENLGPEANRSTLEYLRRLLSEYEQEKNVLEAALKQPTSGTDYSSPDIIERKIRDLFSLRHFGKKIKQLYNLHQTVGLREHKQSEYVVKEQYTLSLVDTVKSYGNSLLGAIGFKKSSRKQHRIEVERQRAIDYDKQMQQYYYHNQGRPQYSDRQYHSHNGGPFFGPDASIRFNNWGPPRYGWEESEYFPSEHRRSYHALEQEQHFTEAQKAAFDRKKDFFESNSYTTDNARALVKAERAVVKKSECTQKANGNKNKRQGKNGEISDESDTNMDTSNSEKSNQTSKDGQKGNKKKNKKNKNKKNNKK